MYGSHGRRRWFSFRSNFKTGEPNPVRGRVDDHRPQPGCLRSLGSPILKQLLNKTGLVASSAEGPKLEKKAGDGIAPPAEAPYNLPDNSVGILSRVAEGLGPEKPQQPVFLTEDAGATSYPALAGRDKIVCLAHLLLFTHRCRPFPAALAILFWTIRTCYPRRKQGRSLLAPRAQMNGGIVRVRLFRPRPQVPTV